MAPTGSGKTILAMNVIQETLIKGKKCLFICDRKNLINQTSEVADSLGLSAHGIIMAQHWRFNPRMPFQIASVQTLMRRGIPDDFDTIVVDEAHCFPGDTLISTPDGEKRIDTLSKGDIIYNSCGESHTVNVLSRTSKYITTVRLTDGTKIECTPEHPIFTHLGWRPAGTLEIGTVVLRKKDMQSLWRGDYPLYHTLRHTCGIRRVRDFIHYPRMLQQILCEEIEESDAFPRGAGTYVKDIEAYWSHSETGRQRYGNDGNAGVCDGEIRGGMDGGISGKNPEIIEAGIPAPLQTGHCECDRKSMHRTGREEPLSIRAEGSGYQERCLAKITRVASVETEERASDTTVYNLHVSGHPSYFANGVLVHNCQYSATMKHIQNCRGYVIGLSATPFSAGLGNTYTNLINAATMDELTKTGILVPMRVFSCSKIDMKGAETRGGEWTQEAAGSRGLEIVGDVVTEWMKYASTRKTIVFGATIAHCEEMALQFNTAGFKARVFCADTPDEERESILREFTRADSRIRILVSVEALAKGFDVKDVECLSEGSLILTHRGEIAIDKLLLSDKIWDGFEFVAHGGTIYKGEQNVITYAGITATADHPVKTSQGWVSLGVCLAKKIPIRKTGIGGQAIFESENMFSDGGMGGSVVEKTTHGKMYLRGLLDGINSTIRSIFRKKIAWMRSVQKDKSDTALACCQGSEPKGTMPEPEAQGVSRLRRTWHRVSVFFSKSCREMDNRKLGNSSAKQEHSTGQEKQRRTLRTGEFEMDFKDNELLQYAPGRMDGKGAQIQVGTSRNQICRQNTKESVFSGANGHSDNREVSPPVGQTKRHVWDILNAGPRNSFTCNGLLVHNCVCDCRPLRKSLSTAIQMWGRGLRSSPETGKVDCMLLDFSGNLIRFADDYSDIFYQGLDALDMGEKLDKAIRKDDEEKDPPKCEKCGYTPCGKVCVSCGHERKKQSNIEVKAGNMQEITLNGKVLADNSRHLYEQICTHTRSQGKPETARNRAFHLYKDMAGKQPPNTWKFEDAPNVPITQNVANKIKAIRIAYAKRVR
jgi:superfamily II DNA or RNA helicase